jgi:hypothetical protein
MCGVLAVAGPVVTDFALVTGFALAAAGSRREGCAVALGGAPVIGAPVGAPTLPGALGPVAAGIAFVDTLPRVSVIRGWRVRAF